jgi:hypothetical protein
MAIAPSAPPQGAIAQTTSVSHQPMLLVDSFMAVSLKSFVYSSGKRLVLQGYVVLIRLFLTFCARSLILEKSF